MNLRAKKRLVRNGKNNKKEKSMLVFTGIYTFILACLFSSVLGGTLYFNGQSEKINKEIALIDSHSYRLQREIQNLKIKLENFSRKDFIVQKIKQYKLGLNLPEPFQVVHLDSVDYDRYHRKNAQQIAFK